jgi:uncharacterized protein
MNGNNNRRLLMLIPLSALLMVSHETPAGSSERACAIKMPGILFTKCLNGAEQNTTLEGQKLTMKSDARRDYFNDPDGTPPISTAAVLLSRVDNTRPFTFSAKVSPEFKQTYDAGALYIFVDDKLWHKFAFERDERKTTRIVTVKTIETSDDCNHQPVTDAAVYLKISSDTKTVAFYFSSDNMQWNLARLYRNNYPATIWVGLSSQSPLGNGNVSQFENPTLTTQSVRDFRMGT